MKYISDDGKIFETEEECCEHEQSVQEELTEKQKDWAEVEKKHKAYEEARDEFSTAMRAFERKYPVRSQYSWRKMEELLKEVFDF